MVPGEQAGPELSIRAVLLGVLLAAIFGAANAYLGLTAAMTVSTTFPAAVIAIAAFRLPFFRGGVLEQNIARTAATVGEALVAAGIFTLPAFVMIDLDGEHLWSSFNYWQSVAVLLIGGLLGIFFIIVMRRALTVDAKLPFPESYACYEIVKAGQGGQSGAAYVFGAMGMGLLLELLKNDRGLTLCQSVKEFLVNLPGVPVKLSFTSPAASPALLSVGYIIGPRYAAIAFSGGVLAWFVLIPLSLLLGHFPSDPAPDWSSLAFTAWRTQVRPIAVGAMLVGSFYTLWGLRGSLISALGGAFRSRKASAGAVGPLPRRERDLNLRLVLIVALLLALPSAALFYMWTHDWTGTLVATGLLMLLGFLLSVIGGWIVGLIGSSNQPVSGITLAGLIVTGVLLLALRVTGLAGVAASLGLAVMICTAASLSGTLIQELKVGQFLGATPWKMELAQILSTIAVAFVVIFPMILLHQSDIATGGTGIGGKALPAPQAGLMAHVAQGIISGEISWNLVMLGMAFALTWILMGVPSPMVIAVGMYLPLETTFAIFVGGVFKWWLHRRMTRFGIRSPRREEIENTGTLIASGLIAGEALMGVLVAGMVLTFLWMAEASPAQWGFLHDSPSLTMFLLHQEQVAWVGRYGAYLAVGIFAAVAMALIWVPLRRKD